jgi:hypothetical protein
MTKDTVSTWCTRNSNIAARTFSVVPCDRLSLLEYYYYIPSFNRSISLTNVEFADTYVRSRESRSQFKRTSKRDVVARLLDFWTNLVLLVTDMYYTTQAAMMNLHSEHQ